MRKGGVLRFVLACLAVASALWITGAAGATSLPTVPTSDWHNYQGGEISWKATSGGIEINYPGEFLGYPRSSTQGSESARASVVRETWWRYKDIFVEAARTYKVPPIVMLAIAATESDGNADVLGGIMQTSTYNGRYVSARDSIMDAARGWLGSSYRRYQGDPIFQAAAYNAGSVYQSRQYSKPVYGYNAWNMMMYSSDGTHYGSYAWNFAANFNAAVPIVGLAYVPPESQGAYLLKLEGRTEHGCQPLRTRVEVNYRKPNGQWVEYESHWSTDMIQVTRNTRAYVFLREDPSGYAGRFLFWDNYGIARGPPGDRNWYLDMNSDRTMVATYRDLPVDRAARAILNVRAYPNSQHWPDNTGSDLNANIEVQYQKLDGSRSTETSATPFQVQCAKSSKATVTVRSPCPSSHVWDLNSKWDCYAVGYGPSGQASMEVSMDTDRTAVAYLSISTTTPERRTIPFSGMYAVYEAEQSGSDPSHGRWSFRGTLKYTIDRVFGTFCDITYLMRGDIYADSRETRDWNLPLIQESNYPIDKDTLFYLLPTTDPTKTTPISIHMIPGMGVSARLDYKGTQMIKVPRGSFNCYRLEGSIDVVNLPVHLWTEPGEVTLYYDVNSRLLVYLHKKSGSFESKLSLK